MTEFYSYSCKTAETEEKPETPLQLVSQSSTNTTIIAQADSTSADPSKEIEFKELNDCNMVTDTIDNSLLESDLKISTVKDNLKRPFVDKEEMKPKKLKEDLSQSIKGLSINYFNH